MLQLRKQAQESENCHLWLSQWHKTTNGVKETVCRLHLGWMLGWTFGVHKHTDEKQTKKRTDRNLHAFVSHANAGAIIIIIIIIIINSLLKYRISIPIKWIISSWIQIRRFFFFFFCMLKVLKFFFLHAQNIRFFVCRNEKYIMKLGPSNMELCMIRLYIRQFGLTCVYKY